MSMLLADQIPLKSSLSSVDATGSELSSSLSMSLAASKTYVLAQLIHSAGGLGCHKRNLCEAARDYRGKGAALGKALK
jgi:hypothetical protein